MTTPRKRAARRSTTRSVRASVALLLTAVGTIAACEEVGDPTGDPEVPVETQDSPVIVSNPIQGAAPGAAAARSAGARAASASGVTYVSLLPGTEPDGAVATIRNLRTGSAVPAAMAGGGFDPVPVEADAGDTLEIAIQVAGSTTPVVYLIAVPPTRRPIVVRTDPPPRKRDVPLNAAFSIVFSEPVQASTLGSIQLLRGASPRAGQVTLSADRLRAVFRPDAQLDPNAEYVLSVPTDILDLSGDALEQAVTVEFTTGTTAAVASVVTAEAALYTTVISGTLASMTFDAVLHGDGRITGSYTSSPVGADWNATGQIVCFATDGNEAWLAGETDGGRQHGWRFVDNGPGTPGTGPPDQKSDTYWLTGSPRAAQDWCATTPRVDPWFGEIVLYDLLGGDIVVSGTADPPPRTPGLVFVTQPTAMTAGDTVRPSVQVAIVDSLGAIMTSATDTIELRYGGAGSVEEATTVPTSKERVDSAWIALTPVARAAAVNGVATFTDLEIDVASSVEDGTEPHLSVLHAYAPPRYCCTFSAPFYVAGASATRLQVGAPDPGRVAQGEVFSLWASVLDAYGNWADQGTYPIALSLAPNAFGGTLSGTVTRTTVGGRVTFDGLSIDVPGTYGFVATSPGLSSGESEEYYLRVTGPPGPPERIQGSVVGSYRESRQLLLTDSTRVYSVVAYDSTSTALPGVPIQWTVAGVGSLSPSLDTTAFDWDETPQSRATLLVGPTEGQTTVTATAITIPGVPQLDFTSNVVSAIAYVGGDGFEVDSVVVPSGRTVGWAWRAGSCRFGTSCADHNVTLEDDSATSSPLLHAAGPFVRTFAGPPRTIRYRCTLHSTDFDGPVGEVGRVIVR